MNWPPGGDVATRGMPTGVAGRAIALLLALLTVGLFAGSSVFHETSLGLRWFHQASACAAVGCTGSGNGWLVTFQLAGVACAVAATAALAVLAPRWLIRRRGLRPFAPELGTVAQRVSDLAFTAGCPRAPGLYLAPVWQRDAVTFGTPGRYRIALPPSLVVRHRHSAVFDPIVRHELAHIRHHDVLIAWSIRPALWVSGALLVLPIVFGIVDGDMSLMPSYVWRALLLLAVTVLVCAGILRAREFEADAAAAGDVRSAVDLRAVLTTLPRAHRRRWQGLLALHPTPQQRLLALEDPASGTKVDFLGAATVSFLTSLSVSLVGGLVAERLSWTTIAPATGPTLGGLLLGCTLGPALWGAAQSAAAHPRPVAAGTFLGYAAGAVASLNEVGTDTIGAADLRTVVVDAALAAGTIGLVVAGSTLAPRVVSRVGARAAALLSAASASLTIGVGLWLARLVSLAARIDLETLRETVVSLAGTRRVADALILLAAVLLTILVLAGQSRWPRHLATGAAYCLGSAGAATLVILAFRIQAGAPPDLAHAQQRLDAYVWVWALAGAAAGLGLAIRYGRGGLAAAPATTTLTCLLAGGLFTLLNAAYGGGLSWGFVTRTASLSTGLGYTLMALVALAWSLVTRPAARPVTRPAARPVTRPEARPAARPAARSRDRVRARAGLLAAFCVPVVLGGIAVAGRERVSPLSAAEVLTQGTDSPSRSQGPAPNTVEVAHYRTYAQLVIRSTDTTLEMDSLMLDPATLAPSTLIREDLVAPTRQQLALAATMTFHGSDLTTLHAELVKALRLQVQGYTEAADAIDTGDVVLSARSAVDRRAARTEFDAWLKGVAALH